MSRFMLAQMLLKMESLETSFSLMCTLRRIPVPKLVGQKARFPNLGVAAKCNFFPNAAWACENIAKVKCLELGNGL